MTPKQVLAMIKEKGVVMVDVKFIDLLGTWQHFTAPISEFKDEAPFDEGLGFDGSSIRGWQAIDNSDMLVIPDPDTAVMDPFTKDPTLSIIVQHLRSDYPRRLHARPAQHLAQGRGVSQDHRHRRLGVLWTRAGVFHLRRCATTPTQNSSYYYIDSNEGNWNSGKEGAVKDGANLGFKVKNKAGYFPVPPVDTLQDIRTEMVLEMERVGIRVEKQHHEVATAGQAEIDMRFQTLTKMADWLTWYKYIVKNVAVRHGMTATFMPKPIFGDNGTGMHTHQSIWKGETPLFAGNGYAGMSETAMHYIAGILHHAPTIAAFTNPGTNSYRRLVPGFEAPINLAYSSRNRSASVRIPMYSPSPKAKRIEVRFPDPTCNPYLAFSAMLMAGIDGIQRRLDPGQPLDKDIYALTPAELAEVPSMPASLEESLGNLKKDHEFLLKGDVFTEDLIETWIEYKMANEVSAIRLRPHPYEFALYYDA